MSSRGADRNAVVTQMMDTNGQGFEFQAVGRTLAEPIVTLARDLLSRGMKAREVCSLFTQTAAVLSQQEDGLSREEWLSLCRELLDLDELEESTTAPGGIA